MDQTQEINSKIKSFSKKVEDISYEVRKVLVGQDDMLAALLIGLLSEGHLLLEGAPGLAKTLAVKTFAKAIGLPFKRIQFTPDLLPSDVIGTEIYNQNESKFTTNPGPIFASIILADEINGAPAKVQSSLLEAMQERQVTIGKSSFRLPSPFMVLATQNPIEQEGTYQLPEAQVDRFLMKVNIDYPSALDEETILERVVIAAPVNVGAVLTQPEVLEMINFVKFVYIDKKIIEFIVSINTRTRELSNYKELEDLRRYIEYGSSPRGAISLAQVSRSRAILSGRSYVTPEDVIASVNNTLSHRIILSYEALAEGINQAYIIERILETIKVPDINEFAKKPAELKDNSPQAPTLEYTPMQNNSVQPTQIPTASLENKTQEKVPTITPEISTNNLPQTLPSNAPTGS